MRGISIATIWFFICGLPLCRVSYCYGQTYIYDNISTEQGLVHSKVTSICQDHLGYLWFATEAGVSRYDGNTFSNFNQSHGLSESPVTTVFQDKKNKIWFGHSNGTVTTYFNNEFNIISFGKEVNKPVHCFWEDERNNIWIGTESGAIQYLVDSFKIFKGKDGLGDVILSIVSDKANNLWFVTELGIKIKPSSKDVFKPLEAKGLKKTHYYTLYKDQQDQMWIGSVTDGLAKYDVENNHLTYNQKGLLSGWITSIQQDYFGNIWVSTWGGGIAKLTEDGFINYSNSEGLSDSKIFMLYKDQEQNFWIATNESGVDYFKGELVATHQTQHGLISNSVGAIAYIDNKLWIGTDKGIQLFDPQTKLISEFAYNTQLNGYRITSIQAEKRGNIWIGTWGAGLFKFDRYSQSISQYSSEQASFIDQYISDIQIDTHGSVWVATHNGIAKRLSEKDWNIYSQINGLISNDINTLYVDKTGCLWAGPHQGNGINYLKNDSFYTLPIETSGISVVQEDELGNLWIGTKDRGILRMDANRQITNFSTEQGLISNYVTAITSTLDSTMWIGTNIGISQFSIQEQKFSNYGKEEGVLGGEIQKNALEETKDRKVWIGTINGLTQYDPKYEKPFANPQIIINEMQAKEQVLNTSEYIELLHNQNPIRFEFTGFYYSNSKALKYSYKLNGLENNNWSKLDEKRYESFPVLPPGKYTLQVKAINNQGLESVKPASFSFTILPPWYLTNWAITLFILLTIGITFLLIRWRTKRLEQDKKLLEERVQERTAELQQEKQKVEHQALEITSKNKDILDSIQYARKIQVSLLPETRDIRTAFPQSFIFYRPRDIVSGDFYWSTSINENEHLIAAVDCTGHGVPGAFMSMIGFSQLNQIVNENSIHKPSDILKQLNTGVQKALKQSKNTEVEYAKDGMELGLIHFNRTNNKIQFSGANRPLYHIRDGSLIEIKGDKVPIGGEAQSVTYTNYEISIEAGDCMYIFSDGYPDQFGGEKGKKFMTKRFKDLLVKHAKEDINVQKQIIENTMNKWRRGIEQVDDMLVIGLKF